MNKVRRLIVFVLLLLATIGVAWAGYQETPYKTEGSYLGNSTYPYATANINTLTVNTSLLFDITRTKTMSLASFYSTASDTFLTDSTEPNVALLDAVPGIVYASSAEVTSIMRSFPLDADYSGALKFHAMVSSSTSTTDGMSLDWGIYVNEDDTTFDTSLIPQASGSISTPCNGSNEVMTLTLDATGLAAISAGDLITFALWNSDTRPGKVNTTEIKGVWRSYTATH